jgi:glycosyltransferase involved in cell wall biosynthesis
MTSQPFFSIIIPTLNEEKRVPLLLTDLSQQTFLNFEVIVVDGHSDDKTIAKAKLLKNKLPSLRIFNSPDRNVCAQRNLGAQSAKADTFIFMDADDRIPPFLLQGIKYKLESDPSDLATLWIESDDRDKLTPLIAAVVNHFQELATESPKPFLLEALIVVKKEIFRRIGGFDRTIPFAEGDALAKACIEHGYQYKIYRDPKYIFSFRRLRKFGLLKLNSQIVVLQFMKILNLQMAYDQAKRLYPMEGGAALEMKKNNRAKQKQILREIDKVLGKIKINNKPLQIQTLKDSMRTLFS